MFILFSLKGIIREIFAIFSPRNWVTQSYYREAFLNQNNSIYKATMYQRLLKATKDSQEIFEVYDFH